MKTDDPLAAGRYAEALFGAAEGTGEIDAVARDVSDLQAGFEVSGLRRFLGDPQYRMEEKQKAIRALGGKFGSKLTTGLLVLLLRKDRFALLEAIGRRFGELAEEKKGVIQAQVTLARRPGRGLERRIEDALARMTKKKVEMALEVRPEIVGGIIVRMKHYLLDTSVVARLREIRNRLLEVRIL